MSFFDSAKTEFGKKTGKAIGNALYGKHADDKRVGIRRLSDEPSTASSQNTIDYESIERSRRETIKYEQDSELLQSIVNLQFDTQDKFMKKIFVKAHYRVINGVRQIVNAHYRNVWGFWKHHNS